MRAIYILWYRNVLKYVRSKSRLIGSLGMPFFFMVVLGFGLNKAVQLPGMTGGYMEFVAPGIIGMSILFGSMFSGIQLVMDKQFGFLKETFVAPVSRLSLMLGQTLGGATTATLHGILVLIMAFFLGIPLPSVPNFLLTVFFMFLIGISFTALGIAFASQMEDTEGFGLIINFVNFPIFFLSGALFPLNQVPDWLLWIAYFDPLTYGVEGMRFALMGSTQIDVLICLLGIGGFAGLMIVLGSYLFYHIKI